MILYCILTSGLRGMLGWTIGILGIKSLTECFLYVQPMLVRVAKNSYAFVADIVVMIASIPICEMLEKKAIKE